MNFKGLIIDDEGVLNSIAIKPVPNPGAVFSRLCTGITMVPLSTTQAFICDQASSTGIGVTRLPALRLPTQWYHRTTTTDRYLVPCARSDVGDSHVGELTLVWKPNPEVAPVFCTCFKLSSNGGVSGLGFSYLFFTDVSTGQTYVPPLPNVHSEGRLCTGDLDPDRLPGGILDAVEHVLNRWTTNAWNTDLLTSDKHDVLHKYFSFGCDGTQRTERMTADPFWFRGLPVSGTVLGDTAAAQEVFTSALQHVCQ